MIAQRLIDFNVHNKAQWGKKKAASKAAFIVFQKMDLYRSRFAICS